MWEVRQVFFYKTLNMTDTLRATNHDISILWKYNIYKKNYLHEILQHKRMGIKCYTNFTLQGLIAVLGKDFKCHYWSKSLKYFYLLNSSSLCNKYYEEHCSNHNLSERFLFLLGPLKSWDQGHNSNWLKL